MILKLRIYWPAFLLIPAVLSLFWPALLQPATVLYPTFSLHSDIMVIHWPKVYLMAQSWQIGQGLPYWTPLILSGMPLAANQLAMLFYPPAWLFLIWPVEVTFNLFFIWHLIWAGLGMTLLLHEYFKVAIIAAVLGGLTFALGGKLLAHTAGGHVSMMAAIAWMPWLVWFFLMTLAKNEAVKAPRGMGVLRPMVWVILAAAALAMQLTTHSLPVIYSVYLMAAMLVWQFANSKGLMAAAPQPLTGFIRSFAYSLLLLFAVLILAALLGAAQLLPLAELAQYSNRALSPAQAAEFALTPVQLLVGLLLPSAKSGHEYVIYLGLVPLLLAVFGLTRRHRWIWFFGLLLLFALLFSLGPDNPLHTLFFNLAPGFRWVRTPARMMFVGALAVAVLAGLGADRVATADWSSGEKKWLTRLTVAIAPLALLLGLGLAFGLTSPSPYKGGDMGGVQRSALALALFVPATLGLILLRAQQVVPPSLALAGLTLLTFLDLAWFGASLRQFISLEQALAPGQAVADYLAQQPGQFRVYSPSYSLPIQTAAANGLRLADGVEPVHLVAYDQFMARAGGYQDASFSVTIPKFNGPPETALQQTEPSLKLLGLLNVTHLAAAFPMNWSGLTLEKEVEGTYLYRNQLALPPAWVAHQAIPTNADWLAQLESLPNLADVVTIENFPSTPSLPHPPTSLPASKATITHYSADQITVETNLASPGWLVLSEIWYPGWQVMVNGSLQPVERVDGLLRGVYLVEPGPYKIELTYRPNSVIWGIRISAITTTLLLIAGIFYQWRSRPR